jgi:NAD(P)-dependent dehydrogenase (short-subunit alcohol dehydrogenase family)
MINNPFGKGLFKGKNVIVTGAGRGIGAAVAAAFAADGARVFAHLGREQSLEHWVFPENEQRAMFTLLLQIWKVLTA